MNVTIDNSVLLGIPMIFPYTWEEQIAANMEKIPVSELFPGILVSNLYKAYRAGLNAGKYSPWSGSDPGDLTVGYIADSTGTRADVVRDFLDAVLLTILEGKAPASILTGQEPTGIAEKTGQAIEETTEKAGQALKSVSVSFIPLAVFGVSIALIYVLSIIPKARRI